ncbi:MAG: helix-turn-helix transcriptional regulator [Sphingomonas sp.]
MSVDTIVSGKVIRDAAFALRLEQSCDASPHCPPMHRGRLTWIAEQLTKQFKEQVSVQTVARWMNGEAKPRQAKNVKLATLLNVDPVWLYMGVESDITPRERKVRNAMADGAVNVVAGLIQMDGGYPAFPEEKDTRAHREHVDLYAVIKGANYALHVALGKETDGGYSFSVPANHDHVVMLGAVRDGFAFRIVELTTDLMEAHGNTSGRSMTIALSDDVMAKHQLSSFAQRL